MHVLNSVRVLATLQTSTLVDNESSIAMSDMLLRYVAVENLGRLAKVGDLCFCFIFVETSVVRETNNVCSF